MSNLNNLIQQENVTIKDAQIPIIQAYFDNLEKNLIDKIKQNSDKLIFGCVAWLTSEPVLKALAKCDNVQILIQKEDFLRPDINSRNSWSIRLRKLYADLKFNHFRFELKDPIRELSICDEPVIYPVMCVGNHNKEKHPAFPRSHHKFLVFCEKRGKLDEYKIDYAPTAVWTGSFNFTKNATHSFENALYIEDKSGNNPILQAYLNEHHQIFTLSEMLDWETTWIEPRYRIGT